MPKSLTWECPGEELTGSCQWPKRTHEFVGVRPAANRVVMIDRGNARAWQVGVNHRPNSHHDRFPH